MKKYFIIFIITFIGITSCKNELTVPQDSENNRNLNSLLTLKIGKNTMYLQDFVMNPSEVDSITSSSGKLICQ